MPTRIKEVDDLIFSIEYDEFEEDNIVIKEINKIYLVPSHDIRNIGIDCTYFCANNYKKVKEGHYITLFDYLEQQI